MSFFLMKLTTYNVRSENHECVSFINLSIY